MALVDVDRGRADAIALAGALSEGRGATPEQGSPRRSSSVESFRDGAAETDRLMGEPDR